MRFTMAIQKFDDVNQMSQIPDIWYDKMRIPPRQKKKRAELAIDYCEIIIMLFLMITEEEYERQELIAFLSERLRLLAERELGAENIAYINDWSKQKAEDIVDITYEKYENEIEDQTIEEEETTEISEDKETKPEEEKTITFSEFDITIPEKDYWTSDIRAMNISLNLASFVYNFKEYDDAIKEGKTRKVWQTEADDRVRATHDAVDGVDIPINEVFTVGNSLMLFPGDTSYGAEEKELDNCRCHLVCY